MTDNTGPDWPGWLARDALPLWSGVGIDAKTGTAWEALDHAGVPMRGMDRRLRVQARQAFVFAACGDPAHRPLALQLFRFVMDHGFDPSTGNLAATLDPQARRRATPHDLYDLSFVMLAAAALAQTSADVAGDIVMLDAALDRLKAPRGWHEDASYRQPRRQNPHMHLFEAATALYAATGLPRYRTMAQEALDLFGTVFLQSDGCVLERFDEDWKARTGPEETIEPGHMAEWIYLLDTWETVTGTPSGIDLVPIWQAVLARRDRSGLLPDYAWLGRGESVPAIPATRRLWPQTEFLKAACVMQVRDVSDDPGATPEAIGTRLWSDYVNGSVCGGWYDRRDGDGTLSSHTMPASTFYHLLVAIQTLAGRTERPADARRTPVA